MGMAARRDRLIANIASMGALQLGQLLLPLITLPHLTRTLGVSGFGEMVFAQLCAQFLVVLTSYSFSWTGTQAAARAQTDPHQLSRVLMTTLVAQVGLMAAGSVVYALVVWCVPSMQEHAWTYAASLLIVIANVGFPLWFFQGIERVKQVVWLQLACRAIGIWPVLWFIDDQGDAALATALVAAPSVVAAMLALGLLWREGFVRNVNRPLDGAARVLSSGRRVFFSRVWIALYTTAQPGILGAIAGTAQLAQFALADKLRQAAQSGVTPVSQALYARVNSFSPEETSKRDSLLVRGGAVTVLLAAAAAMALSVLSSSLTSYFGGESFREAATVLRILAPLPVIVGLSNLFGVQILLTHGLDREFSRVVGGGAIVSLLVLVPAAKFAGATGAALSIVATESLVTAMMLAVVWRKGLLPIAAIGQLFSFAARRRPESRRGEP